VTVKLSAINRDAFRDQLMLLPQQLSAERNSG